MVVVILGGWIVPPEVEAEKAVKVEGSFFPVFKGLSIVKEVQPELNWAPSMMPFP